ncbi:MAG: hypothetical protein AMDU5_GPLC00017G0052 [Thermoplasmatales archaeon Gpl]|nr:MAG: hypothetical protein AMDU5_GPLC00017G0052 [Thermoplasmatales archaeon Gpl]
MDIEKYTREVLYDIKQRGEEALKEYSSRLIIMSDPSGFRLRKLKSQIH